MLPPYQLFQQICLLNDNSYATSENLLCFQYRVQMSLIDLCIKGTVNNSVDNSLNTTQPARAIACQHGLFYELFQATMERTLNNYEINSVNS